MNISASPHKPEACQSISRWLSLRPQATPPVIDLPRHDPGRGHTHAGIPAGMRSYLRFVGGVGRLGGGLNHRLISSHPSGMKRPATIASIFRCPGHRRSP